MTLSLILFLILFQSSSIAQDICCSNGWPSNIDGQWICCSSSCGACGGNECDGYPGGESNCCPNKIISNGISCDESNAPCIITSYSECC